MGNLVLVCSEKRDVGKTILGIKMGSCFSQRGKNVLLMDLSSGNKKISEYLNINEDIIYDIKDVLDGICSVSQSVIKVRENLSVLPYPRVLSKLGCIKRDSFNELILRLKSEYDIIIVDMDSIAEGYYVDFSLADAVITVANNDFSAIKEINSASQISDKFGIKKNAAVLNRYDRKGARKGLMLKSSELKKITGGNICGVIEESTRYYSVGYDFLLDNEENIFTTTVETNAFTTAVEAIVNFLAL